MTFGHASDKGSSVRFQFEVLTLFVGAFELLLFYYLFHRPEHMNLIVITLLNLAPWGTGWWQWKKASRKINAEEGSSGNATQEAILLVLWATYFALANVEYFWLIR